MFKIIFPTLNFKIERWKWNKEYRVYVSNQGHFKDEHKKNIYNKINQRGYVNIKTPYGYKLAHRLVMLTWMPVPNAESLTIDHLNHNKRDNSLNNLEWVSKEENLKRATEDFTPFFKNIDNNKIIYTRKKIYKNLDEAVQDLLNNPIFLNNPTKIKPENIANNIVKSIINGKKYCGEIWGIEE